jgi:hypothetical protein
LIHCNLQGAWDAFKVTIGEKPLALDGKKEGNKGEYKGKRNYSRLGACPALFRNEFRNVFLRTPRTKVDKMNP